MLKDDIAVDKILGGNLEVSTVTTTSRQNPGIYHTLFGRVVMEGSNKEDLNKSMI